MMSCKPRQLNKFLSFLSISLGGTGAFGALLMYRGDEYFYSNTVMPIVTKYIDPELAHEACIFLTKHKLIKCRNQLNSDQNAKLKTRVLGMTFDNPIGLAAGFDKNSQAVAGLSNYGLGFAEVGTVTPKPQSGNQKKRIFRISKDKALINRCGFNNDGIDCVYKKLSQYESFGPMLVGLNLGKNKDTTHISSDYLLGLEVAKGIKSIDYIVINISSPNTPGLRDSQDKKNLELLLDDVLRKMSNSSINKPLFIKIAPDLSESQIKDIADVVTKRRCGSKKVDGIILTNTSVSRPETLGNDNKAIDLYKESGGLSGRPLRDISTDIIRKFYRATNGQLPIIGVGGVSTGQDAYDKIKAGASLIQLYTSLTYEGPPVVNKIKRELVDLLEKDNLSSIEDAIGIDHKV